MSLHIRHVAQHESPRVQIKYRRVDLLYKTDEVLTSPNGKITVHGLPIYPGRTKAVGPTLADMLTREVMAIDNKLQVVWQLRELKTLWPDRRSKKPAEREVSEVQKSEKPVDHPFQRALASGGDIIGEDEHFVRVDKFTTISIAEYAFKLAVGMHGDVAEAYSHISRIAATAWNADLVRARTIFDLIVQAGGRLIEDSHVAALRPASSVSQQVEADIMRECCVWLGVPDDIDFKRGRGRPSQAAPGEEGEVIRVTFDAQNRVAASMKKPYHGIPEGANLSDLPLLTLIELLGRLRTDQLDIDANLLEAFLEVAAPDWREHVAENDQEGQHGAAHMNPYEVLDVEPAASMDDVRKAYKRAMQKVHPDTSGLSRVFSQMVADAYREIRQERGEI